MLVTKPIFWTRIFFCHYPDSLHYFYGPDATPDDKKTAPDRYSFEDPRSILSNFFSPKTKKQVGDQTYYTGLSSDGATGVELGRAPAELPEKQMDLVADSCIDWGALTPREVAAAFM